MFQQRFDLNFTGWLSIRSWKVYDLADAYDHVYDPYWRKVNDHLLKIYDFLFETIRSLEILISHMSLFDRILSLL